MKGMPLIEEKDAAGSNILLTPEKFPNSSPGIRMDSKVIIPFKWLSKDGKLLLAARTLRTFAYGFLSVVLAIYLKLIGFNELDIGLILTATLLNSVMFTLVASFY